MRTHNIDLIPYTHRRKPERGKVTVTFQNLGDHHTRVFGPTSQLATLDCCHESNGNGGGACGAGGGGVGEDETYAEAWLDSLHADSCALGSPYCAWLPEMPLQPRDSAAASGLIGDA